MILFCSEIDSQLVRDVYRILEPLVVALRVLDLSCVSNIHNKELSSS